MYSISPTATPAERLAWCKANLKLAKTQCPDWPHIPEIAAEVKAMNREISKLKHLIKAQAAQDAVLAKSAPTRPEPQAEQTPINYALGVDNYPETPAPLNRYAVQQMHVDDVVAALADARRDGRRNDEMVAYYDLMDRRIGFAPYLPSDD